MRLRSFLAAAVLLAGFAAPALAAGRYDRLYVFGDSLVDSGNARVLSPTSVPPVGTADTPAYPSGRFTNGVNGRNFADDVSRALGLGDATAAIDPTVRSLSPFQFNAGPGTNFAVGGATVAFTDGETRPDLGSEIRGLPANATAATQPNPYNYNYEYAVANNQVAPIDANSLVLIADGGNDIRNFQPGTDPNLFVQTVAASLGAGLQTLYNDGARNIVLVGVPDIGLLPGIYGTSLQASLTGLSNALNAAYGQVAKSFTAEIGTQGIFRLVDIASLQNAIVSNPALIGSDPTKVHQSCYFDGGATAVAADCAGYLYYDRIHPTSAVHQLIADAILAQLPEPSSWTLMILGFGATGAALRRARRTAAPA